METLKKISMLLCFLLLFTAGFCDDDEDMEFDCDECVDAQADLCNALLNANCSASNVTTAIERVDNNCPNGEAKSAAIIVACGLGDNLNCLGFSCE